MKQFVMMIFAFATFMACGDDNNGTTERIPTDADMFVASEQFQEYQEVVGRDRSEIRSIVNRMSAKEKKTLYNAFGFCCTYRFAYAPNKFS